MLEIIGWRVLILLYVSSPIFVLHLVTILYQVVLFPILMELTLALRDLVLVYFNPENLQSHELFGTQCVLDSCVPCLGKCFRPSVLPLFGKWGYCLWEGCFWILQGQGKGWRCRSEVKILGSRWIWNCTLRPVKFKLGDWMCKEYLWG